MYSRLSIRWTPRYSLTSEADKIGAYIGIGSSLYRGGDCISMLFSGPDRIHVSMRKVVSTLSAHEHKKQEENKRRSFLIRLLNCCHLSSANFEYARKADLDVRQLCAGRQKMPVFLSK